MIYTEKEFAYAWLTSAKYYTISVGEGVSLLSEADATWSHRHPLTELKWAHHATYCIFNCIHKIYILLVLLSALLMGFPLRSCWQGEMHCLFPVPF